MLTRKQILDASDIKTETVKVPEWGGDVIVTTLTGTELNKFQSSLVQGGKTDLTNIMVKLVALCVVTDKGKRIFKDSDITVLGEKSASAISRIFEVAQRLNKLDDKDVKELEKNSGKIRGSNST